jgi:hypothetical protein
MDAMSLLGNDHLPLVIGALRSRSTLFEERPGGLEGYLQKCFFPQAKRSSSEALFKHCGLFDKGLNPKG